jgi:hypothetical protein
MGRGQIDIQSSPVGAKEINQEPGDLTRLLLLNPVAGAVHEMRALVLRA